MMMIAISWVLMDFGAILCDDAFWYPFDQMMIADDWNQVSSKEKIYFLIQIKSKVEVHVSPQVSPYDIRNVRALRRHQIQIWKIRTLRDPELYRSFKWLNFALDESYTRLTRSKTCSIDRKSNGEFVGKKYWPKIRSEDEVRAIFMKRKSEQSWSPKIWIPM